MKICTATAAGRPPGRSASIASSKRNEGGANYIKARASGKANAAAKLPPAQQSESRPRSVVDQAYDPASIEKLLKVEAMIDNRVAKALGRLVGLKEYKKLYGATAALPPADAPTLAPSSNDTPAPAAGNLQPGKPSANTKPTKPSGWTVTGR
jgi:hypothetical protein